jgi:cytochrome b pre-mRNA-processing protein 3
MRRLVFLQRLFRPQPARAAGQALLESVTRQARQPVFYAELGAPDTVEGRFELYSLHVVLLLRRLKGQGRDAAAIAQGLFDAYVQSLDDALREMGVGDLSVGKKMRRIGEAFYGRVKGYDSALSDRDDRAGFEALLARTVFAGAPQGQPAALAAYIESAVAALAATPLEAVFRAEIGWPEVTA